LTGKAVFEEAALALRQCLIDRVPKGEGSRLARELGWNKSQLSRLRSSRELPNPQLKTICALAEYLGITPAEILSYGMEGGDE